MYYKVSIRQNKEARKLKLTYDNEVQLINAPTFKSISLPQCLVSLKKWLGGFAEFDPIPILNSNLSGKWIDQGNLERAIEEDHTNKANLTLKHKAQVDYIKSVIKLYTPPQYGEQEIRLNWQDFANNFELNYVHQYASGFHGQINGQGYIDQAIFINHPEGYIRKCVAGHVNQETIYDLLEGLCKKYDQRLWIDHNDDSDDV